MTNLSLRMYHGVRVCALTAALALACGPSHNEQSEPQRIVSIGPELARLLVELGVGPAVVGVDSASLVVPEIAHAADLGNAEAISVELVRRVQPDLVLILSGEIGWADRDVPVHVLAPRDANAVIAAIQRVGHLVGAEPRAREVVARITREVADIATQRDGRSRLTAAWVIGRSPLVVVGGSGLLHEMLELAGAENAFHTPGDERLAVTPEEIAARDPDVVLELDSDLSALPLLDLAGRVRALHVALYPDTGDCSSKSSGIIR